MGVKVMDRCNLTILEQPGAGRPRRIPRARTGRDRRLHALLSGGQCRPPARQGRVRQLDPWPAKAQCAGLRLRGLGPDAQPRLQSARRRRCRRRRRRSRPTTGACSANATASCSTICSRSPTCRSSGSAPCWRSRASSTAICICCATRMPTPISMHVMCRNLISVDWQGFVYDCDFNQMLGLPLSHGGRTRVHLSDLLDADLDDNPIRVAGHCYGCTAGQGSSCGGALSQRPGDPVRGHGPPFHHHAGARRRRENRRRTRCARRAACAWRRSHRRRRRQLRRDRAAGAAARRPGDVCAARARGADERRCREGGGQRAPVPARRHAAAAARRSGWCSTGLHDRAATGAAST